nr:calcium-transporting ATPase 10, plasma membrane-type [Ipomoea batatas]
MILGRNPSGQAAINEQINDAGGDHQERVVRGGRRTPIPIFEIVVADIAPLKIGDQVHADRLVISGHSLALDESSMTGESKIVGILIGDYSALKQGEETFSGQDLSYAIVAVGETPYAETVSDQVPLWLWQYPKYFPKL